MFLLTNIRYFVKRQRSNILCINNFTFYKIYIESRFSKTSNGEPRARFIEGAEARAGAVNPIYIEPVKTPKNGSQESGSQDFLEGFGAGNGNL